MTTDTERWARQDRWPELVADHALSEIAYEAMRAVEYLYTSGEPRPSPEELTAAAHAALRRRLEASDEHPVIDEHLRQTTTVWRISLADLDDLAGRQVSKPEAEAIADSIGHSSIPDSLHVIVGACLDD